MKLVYNETQHQIEFNEDNTNYLIIENVKLYREVIEMIKVDGSEIVLSNQNNVLSNKKSIVLIRDPMSLVFDSKDINSAINTLMKTRVRESDYIVNNNELWGTLERYFIKLVEEFDLSLTFASEENIEGLIKLFNIRLEEDHDDFLEKLIEYIDVMVKLCNKKLIVINNIRAYLTIDETKELYQLAKLKKWDILCLDYRIPESKIEEEKYHIIDKDLCEIY